jgi:hypothetical protein
MLPTAAKASYLIKLKMELLFAWPLSICWLSVWNEEQYKSSIEFYQNFIDGQSGS